MGALGLALEGDLGISLGIAAPVEPSPKVCSRYMTFFYECFVGDFSIIYGCDMNDTATSDFCSMYSYIIIILVFSILPLHLVLPFCTLYLPIFTIFSMRIS